MRALPASSLRRSLVFRSDRISSSRWDELVHLRLRWLETSLSESGCRVTFVSTVDVSFGIRTNRISRTLEYADVAVTSKLWFIALPVTAEPQMAQKQWDAREVRGKP